MRKKKIFKSTQNPKTPIFFVYSEVVLNTRFTGKKGEKYPRELTYSKRYLGYYVCRKHFLWKDFKPLLSGVLYMAKVKKGTEKGFLLCGSIKTET